MYWIKRKFWQIKNVFRWLPIIWKQYDFDYRYSIEVFKFQLQKQAEFLESDNSFTVCAKDRAKRIRTVIKLMDKVYDGEYGIEYIDKLKDMYGESVLGWWFEDTGKGDGSSYLRHTYETWDNVDEIEKVKDELFQKSQDKQRKAHRILWKLIEKDIETWWD